MRYILFLVLWNTYKASYKSLKQYNNSRRTDRDYLLYLNRNFQYGHYTYSTIYLVRLKRYSHDILSAHTPLKRHLNAPHVDRQGIVLLLMWERFTRQHMLSSSTENSLLLILIILRSLHIILSTQQAILFRDSAFISLKPTTKSHSIHSNIVSVPKTG